MSLPPWYRPRRRPLAEALPEIDLSRATGIGPLEPGLSVEWNMKPLLGMADPSHQVRLTVDSKGRALRVLRRGKRVALDLALEQDQTRIGAPLRAVCPGCGRPVFKLYLWEAAVRCGKCWGVTYASGQREPRDRAVARKERLKYRLACTDDVPRRRGRRRVLAAIRHQNARLSARMPASLLKRLLG